MRTSGRGYLQLRASRKLVCGMKDRRSFARRREKGDWKMTRSLTWTAVGVCALAVAPAAHAHHSFAVHFVPEASLSLDGVVSEFRFRNPHGLVYFTVVGDDGREQEWRAETNSPNILRRRGWSEESLHPGDRVTLEMSPYDLTKGRINFRHKEERAAPVSSGPSYNRRRR